MDEETDLIEKQPKTSVIVSGAKTRKGKIEHLLTRRLRQPYYGKVGRITGKVRFGETFQETAERELFEETGLRTKAYKLDQVYRKIRKRKNGTTVQDVVFYIFFVTSFSGKFINKTPYQENFWITKKEFDKADLDTYRDLIMDDRTKAGKLKLKESVDTAHGF